MTSKAAIEAQILSLSTKLAELEAQPDEPFFEDDAAVVAFQKTFSGRSPYTQRNGRWTYNYAAMRINVMNKWIVTGARQARVYYTWEELLEFIRDGESEMPVIWLATDWSQVV